MRFLITNSVPLNGGDEALLRGLILALKQRIGGSSVITLCKNLNQCRELLPDLDLASDLEFSATPLEFAATRGLYRDADAVLSAPGGFFHDHYAIEPRLRGLEVALAFGKPVFLCGQSIGPFWKPESLARIRDVFNRVTQIFVRDRLSEKYLLDTGVSPERITVVTDLAFLWRGLAPECFRAREARPCANIGVCIRPWPLKDAASVEATIEKAVALVSHLLSTAGNRVTFISTCQGVPGYWDDSALALEVLSRVAPSEAARCIVDRQRRGPRELIGALGALDAFIGMRLHGCLLAMLGGTPALGLAYEPKTPEIFGQLGLEEWQLPFTDPGSDWIGAADRFLPNLASLHAALPARLDERLARSNLAVDQIVRGIQAKAPLAA